MDENLDLFRFRRLRRNSDPATSAEAARLIVPKLAHLHEETLAFVKQFPGRTASELAAIYQYELDTRKIGRRLPELVKMNKLYRGPARKCSVTGRNATTWYPMKGV